MKYFLAKATLNNKTGAEGLILSVYNSLDEAKTAYHYALANEINNPDVARVSCAILNEHFGVEMREYWYAETEESEA